MLKTLLLVPPFAPLDRPTLTVSLVKAELSRRGIACDVRYTGFGLAERIGTELYASVAGQSHMQLAAVGDWLFSEAAFGERAPSPTAYVEEVLLGRYGQSFDRAQVDQLIAARAEVIPFLLAELGAIDWTQYGVVVATSVIGYGWIYPQDCATLALLRGVKERSPKSVTVMGGPNCDGSIGPELLAQCEFLDYVHGGEADRVVPALLTTLLAESSDRLVPGVVSRDLLPVLGGQAATPQVLDLDRLAYPDFDDYFQQLAASPIGGAIRPTLNFETSRGCWWGEIRNCTFCAILGERMTYRSKSPERALAELDYLIDRHSIRRISVADQILDMRYFETFLPALASRVRPPRMFYETKANLSRAQVQLLAKAGVREIQPGIESLSSSVLRSMAKGLTGLQAVRLLKWCQEAGVSAYWNILYGLPDEDPVEYLRMAELAESLTHLRPPYGYGRVRLERFSPYFERAAEYGFVDVRPALPYRQIYPFDEQALGRFVRRFDYQYVDGRDPRAYVAQLSAALATWRMAHASARLESADDGARLVIFDSRPGAMRELTVLEHDQRLAYLALESGASVDAVRRDISRVSGNAAPESPQLLEWLNGWVADRLVMREGALYLSLAVILGAGARQCELLERASPRQQLAVR